MCRCRAGTIIAEVVQGCRGAGAGAEICRDLLQKRCRRGAEVTEGVGDAEGAEGADQVLRCRGALTDALVQRCGDAEMQKCRGAEVQRTSRGAEVQRRCKDLQVFRDSEVKVQGAMELRCSLGAKAQQS